MKTPDAIVYADSPASRKGWVYRSGHFYKCEDLSAWLTTNACDDMLDDTDSWLIYDVGDVPPERPRCKILMITSPGNLQKDRKGAKAFHESAPIEVFLPPWTLEECITVAKTIYSFDDASLRQTRERFILYGGIPRRVLEWHYMKPNRDPLGDAVAAADIYKAVNEVGSSEFDHRRVSGKLIHLVPSTDFRSYT